MTSTIDRVVVKPSSNVRIGRPSRPVGLSGIGLLSSFKAHRAFCVQGEQAEYVYRLTEGVAQAYRITCEGRRQILDFYAPDDFIGLHVSGKHPFFVDAITDGQCQIISRAEINPLFSDSALPEELWAGLAKEIQRSRDHSLRLREPSTARVAYFIIQMHERLPPGVRSVCQCRGRPWRTI